MDITNVYTMFKDRNTVLFQYRPNKDLIALLTSWIAVVGSFYLANVIVGPSSFGGLLYFALYAIIGAAIFGLGIPLVWTIYYRQKDLKDLGITKHNLFKSIMIQIGLTVLLFFSRNDLSFPDFSILLPLIALILTIGFFEAIFWRGWFLLRLEENFGTLAGIFLSSGAYAIYHIGYNMPVEEIIFLFFIGLMFAIVFKLTNSIFILWPIFQPYGQLMTLIEDGLELPLLASLGFIEVLIVMWVVVFLIHKKINAKDTKN